MNKKREYRYFSGVFVRVVRSVLVNGLFFLLASRLRDYKIDSHR